MQRCPLCPGINNVVPSDGPEDADLVFVGEAPGKDENKKLKPFIGKTGDEVNRGYLPLCNLRRENVLFTNAIRCLPPGIGRLNSKRDADLQMLQSCAECHLYPELEAARPELIIPMGAFACRAIDPDIDLEIHHGFPLDTSRGTVFPMYHPAGGIHEPKKMLQIRTDWTRLNKYLKGKLKLPKDHFAGIEQYELITDPELVTATLESYRHMSMSCDTEITRQKIPYCLTFSTEPGTGFMILADDKACLAAFQEELNQWRGVILFHNWLFDRDVVIRMGLKFPEKRIRCTMLMAFHLGNIPQGLKALAYRELGMTMMDFDDLVTPCAVPRVLEYYRDCFVEEWDRPEPQLERDKDGKWKLYKPQSFTTKLKRFFKDYEKNPLKDVFEMWTKNWEPLQAEVEERVGPWPGKCITYAAEDRWEDTLRYACRDADATIRLYPVLKRMIRNMRKTVAENWGDYDSRNNLSLQSR